MFIGVFWLAILTIMICVTVGFMQRKLKNIFMKILLIPIVVVIEFFICCAGLGFMLPDEEGADSVVVEENAQGEENAQSEENAAQLQATDGKSVDIEKLSAYTEDNHVIKSHDMKCTVTANNEIVVTEEMTIEFLEKGHGIYKSIPLSQVINRESADGSSKKYRYDTKVEDVWVDDDPYETSKEDGSYVIQIGDEDVLLDGEKSYRYGYTLSIPDDRVDAYDEFYYSILGTDTTTPTAQFTFEIDFEQDTDLAGLEMYADNMIEYTASDNRITGENTRVIMPGEAVTVWLRLPEGYFTGERTRSATFYRIVFILSILLAIGALIRFIMTWEKNISSQRTQSVELYPPEGMTSADMGYVMNCDVSDEEFFSIFVWMASKDYVTIEDNIKQISVHKKKAPEAKELEWVRNFYQEIFKSRSTIDLKKDGEKIKDAVEKAKKEIAAQYTGDRALIDEDSEIFDICLLAPALILAVLGMIATGGDGGGYILIGFPLVAMMGLWHMSESFSKGFPLEMHWVSFLAMAVIAVGVVLVHGYLYQDNLIGADTYPIQILLCLFSAALSGLTCAYTAYRQELAAKIKGYKYFLKMAEASRIKVLVDENPEYFYQVLPFTYVLGVTDQWIKKFEELKLEKPDWYTSDTRAIPSASMVHQASSGYSSSVSSSSGSGGSSGGGFGGGGTGGW